ncbi:MAG: hypothetical protein E7362_03055 [Clostridiales bacterium]|nr:hypothetical protein [Clostridiales bacterium]
MEQQNTKLPDGIVQKIFSLLRRYWGLIVVVTLVAALVGVVYANLVKPTYTATCKTVYKAEFTEQSSYSNVTLTKSYISTFVDFCDEGCVMERANYYYKEFKKSGKTDVDKFATFIKQSERGLKEGETAVYPELAPVKYLGENTYKNKDIVSSRMSASTAQKNGDNFAINIRYTDPIFAETKIKAKLIIVAVELEANVKALDKNGNPTIYSKYFGNATIYFNDLSEGTSISGYVDKTNIIMIFAIVGLVASLVIIYLVNVFNRSVRTREELERITGVGLLAYIADQGE